MTSQAVTSSSYETKQRRRALRIKICTQRASCVPNGRALIAQSVLCSCTKRKFFCTFTAADVISDRRVNSQVKGFYHINFWRGEFTLGAAKSIKLLFWKCISIEVFIFANLYRGITECYDIQLIDLHVSTTVLFILYKVRLHVSTIHVVILRSLISFKFQRAAHNSFIYVIQSHTTCFDHSCGHPQVLNKFQVSEGCSQQFYLCYSKSDYMFRPFRWSSSGP